LGVVRDFRAERWPSMDLCADQLLAHVSGHDGLTAVDLETDFRRRFQRIPLLGRKPAAFNADRLLNRHVVLPRFVRRSASTVDFIHVVDHSYAHLVLAAPEGRAGVYCHDLDAFRSVLEPARDPRPWWFRRLAQRTLNGLKNAAVVFHNSVEIGRELTKWGLVPGDRLVHAPLGVAAEFIPESPGPVKLPVPIAEPFLLHVGSNIPRKRLDVLLDVFSRVLKRNPGTKLIQVGGPWPPHLAEQITRLGVGEAVKQIRGLTREQLAELYRRAAAVLVTSESEGFGLPVIEALACGAAVVASDIPVLREVGGPVVEYCAVCDMPAWAETVNRIVAGDEHSSKDQRLAHAARFSWKEHARIIADAYLRLAAGIPPACLFSS
jgi:glycosyltransferase involved in cell wall biosynthesis